jgi:menaquinone-9 beta-reductase
LPTLITPDVCIVGAGPAGLSTALFLAKKGIKSTVIEKSVFPRDKVCGDAFSGKALWALRKLNEDTESKIPEFKSGLPSWGIKFYGTQNNELKVPFLLDYENSEKSAPGFISKRLDFDNYLFEIASGNPLIEIIQNTTPLSFERQKDYIEIKCKQIDIHCKLIIAADGAYSKAAKELMQFEISDNFNSLGLRTYFSNVDGLDKDGFIELHFLEELLPGYFWIFPLPNGMANVGAGIRTDLMRKHKINLKEVFKKIIYEHPEISKRFKSAKLEDKIRLHGLPLGKPNRKISSERIILTGDAAALIDPFTGEGIGNAVISGMLAAETTARALDKNNFSAVLLSEYDKAVYRRLSSELKLSKWMQELTRFPFVFNLVVNKARKNKELRDTISCMFENVDMRAKFTNPLFYLRILFNQ